MLSEVVNMKMTNRMADTIAGLLFGLGFGMIIGHYILWYTYTTLTLNILTNREKKIVGKVIVIVIVSFVKRVAGTDARSVKNKHDLPTL